MIVVNRLELVAPGSVGVSVVTVCPARAVCAVNADEVAYVAPATRDDRGFDHAVTAARTGGRRVCGVWLPADPEISLQGLATAPFMLV